MYTTKIYIYIYIYLKKKKKKKKELKQPRFGKFTTNYMSSLFSHLWTNYYWVGPNIIYGKDFAAYLYITIVAYMNYVATKKKRISVPDYVHCTWISDTNCFLFTATILYATKPLPSFIALKLHFYLYRKVDAFVHLAIVSLPVYWEEEYFIHGYNNETLSFL